MPPTACLRQAAVRCLVNLAAILFVVCLSETPTPAQSDLSATDAPGPVPESAFVSPLKYTNAFFGFSLTLPQGTPFSALPLKSSDPSSHILFGVQAELVRSSIFKDRPTLTFLTLIAKEAGNASTDEAKKYVVGQKGLKAISVQIGGKEFWKSESEEKTPQGKMQSINFATSLNGYALELNISSFDAKLAEQLQHSVDSLTFFDPTEAEKIAGPDSKPYLISRIGKLSAGATAGNTYTNEELGFSYQFPSRWVVTDRATQEKVIGAGHQAAYGDNPGTSLEHKAAQQCTRILLSVTKYAEGTRTEEPNPLIAVIAADPACLPNFHFPTSVSDRDGIKQAAQQIANSFAGAPFIGQGQTSVSSFVSGGHVIIELSNNSNVSIPDRATPLAIVTSLDFTVAGNYLVTWIFESGSRTELDQMKNTPILWRTPSTESPAIK